MRIRFRTILVAGLVTGAAALAVSPVLSQQNTETIARYTMDAGTMSGMAAMMGGGGGGGQPSLGSIMGMMGGGNSGPAHELILRLGSTRAAQGAPQADHFMPQGAGLGESVPLVTPVRRTGEREEPGEPGQMEMPRGRLLLFWGCGEHAPAGQPVIIDFARMARGEIPPGLFAGALDLPDDWQVLVSNSTTYGDWPNNESESRLTGRSSLVGRHRVAGNYSPEIAFDLAEDFMPALNPAGTDMASGAVRMRWNNLEKATGYYAWAIGAGGRNERDMVWWTSSRTQAFGGPLSDWISPAAAARYVEAGTLMAPGTTECVIPAEVKEQGGEALMTSLYAYGPQVNYSFPERPRNAPASWRPEWIARVRFRSMATMIPGMEAMMGGGEQPEAETAEEAPEQPAGLPRCRGGLRGMAERAAGLCQ